MSVRILAVMFFPVGNLCLPSLLELISLRIPWDHLVQDFRTMITQRQAGVLPRWLKEAQESGIPELRSLAAGMYRDYDAVSGALETAYSNGQTEAQVHRLKLIKRQAYGRASLYVIGNRSGAHYSQ